MSCKYLMHPMEQKWHEDKNKYQLSFKEPRVLKDDKIYTVIISSEKGRRRIDE